MRGRTEAGLPDNFALSLAKRITNAQIFLDHNNTVNTEELEKANYARELRLFSDEEMEELAQQYPNAIEIRA